MLSLFSRIDCFGLSSDFEQFSYLTAMVITTFEISKKTTVAKKLNANTTEKSGRVSFKTKGQQKKDTQILEATSSSNQGGRRECEENIF